MDERMLKTGTVPVGDRINQLPAAANGERKSLPILPLTLSSIQARNVLTSVDSQKRTQTNGGGGGRRGSRVGEIARANGYVMMHVMLLPFFFSGYLPSLHD